MSEISVCYSGNRRVFPGLLLSVLSLVKHTDRPLQIFILSMDMHEANPAFLPFSPVSYTHLTLPTNSRV